MWLLSRKYPFNTQSKWYKDSLIYSLIVFLILYFLRPFGFSSYTGNHLIVSVAFAAITFACSAVSHWMIWRPLQRHISPWTIGWHALCILLMLMLIAIFNYLFFSFLFEIPLSLSLFGMFFWWSFLMSIIITIISTMISYNRKLRHDLASLLPNSTEQQQDILITIHDTSVRGADLELPINDFLYAEARKNMVAVVYQQDDRIVETEIHTTLSSLLESLPHENIFQCHRSFVVNLNNITAASGNSNGYQLTMKDCRHIVPVSRSFVPKLRTFIS